MATSVDGAKARAKLLAQRLNQLGVSIRHTQALEALAASEGFSDWNRYQAHLQHHPGATRTAEESSLTFVALRPGMGKTTAAVRHCQARRGEGPILWINLVDQNGPALATEPGDRTALIAYGPEGNLSPLPVLGGTGVTMLSLMAGVGVPGYTPAGDEALERALDLLLAHVESAIGAGWQPATVVVDEAQRACSLSSSHHAHQRLSVLMGKTRAQWIVLGQSQLLEWAGGRGDWHRYTPLKAHSHAVRDWAERGGRLLTRDEGLPDLPTLRTSLMEQIERLALNRQGQP